MVAKDNCLFLNKQSCVNDISKATDTGNQYSNLNLNQNRKCSDLSLVQSQSKTYNDENCDSTVSNEGPRKLQTWNKSSKYPNIATHNDESEKVKNEWKNDSFSNTINNSSTLSLHITAYENSFEAVTNQFDSKNDKDSIGKWENAKFDNPTFFIQNPFEFPRQQNDKVSEPEMLQYKASQRLFNPNKESKNGQQGDEPVAAQVVQQRFAFSSPDSFSTLRNQIWPLFGAIFMSSVLLQKKPAMLGRLTGIVSRREFSFTAETLKGHSKWQNIKDVKGKNDQMRSQKTNLLLKKVKTATQQGGFDIKLNRKLADVQQEFRAAGLSLDTFNGYLTKLKNKPDLTFHFDMIGPSGSFFIIEAEGENKSKIQSSITKALKKIGHFRFAPDSLMNRFEEKGVIRIDAKTTDGKEIKIEDVEELAIELDCEEVVKVDEEDGPKLEFTTEVSNCNKVENSLTEQGYNVELAEAQLIPLHPVPITDSEAAIVGQFYEQLQEIEEIKQIFDNVESSGPQKASATA